MSVMRIRKTDITMVTIFIMLLPIFQPKIFTQYNGIVILYAFFNLLELFLFLCILFRRPIEARRIHWPILGWILFQGYSFIIMLFNNQMGGILQWGNLSLMVLNFLFVCEYALENMEPSKKQ